jgi:hypothetical protein
LRKLQIFKAALAGLLLAGCGGMNYAMQTYGDVKPVQFVSQNAVWRVFDKPAENLMMLTPSLQDAAAAGATEGITLGMSGDQDAPLPVFKAAAVEYLATTGRRCSITSSRKVLEPQWEFTYLCG